MNTRSAIFTRAAGIASALLGAIVLLGWYTHNTPLIQVLPEFVPMQYNTALGFLLSGVGLIAITTTRSKLTLGCGVIVSAIGLLTLIQYMFAINLGIDQLLMEHYVTTKTSHPGRMAPNTALCFLFTGSVLLLSFFNKQNANITVLMEILGYTVLVLAVVALLGYAARIEAYYGWANLTRMAIHTAVGFIILSIGIITTVWGHSQLNAKTVSFLRLAVIDVLIVCFIVGKSTLYQQQYAQYRAEFSAEELEQLRINYQVTEDIVAELELIQQATSAKPRYVNADIIRRQPRHVWYKARTVFLEVNYLKSAQGLPPAKVPMYPEHAISPKDVYSILQNVLQEVRILRDTYNITETATPSSQLPEVILPLHVYKNLEHISRMIEGIEPFAVAPSHVYQLAELLVLELKSIQQHQHIPALQGELPIVTGKAPKGVYNKAYTLLEALKLLNEKPDYAVSGDVVLFKPNRGHVLPTDVFKLLSSIQAEIGAMRAVVGDTRSLAIPLLKEGKKPSDVYNKVNEALAIVETLL